MHLDIQSKFYLRRSNQFWTFSRPSLKFLTHLHTMKSLVACLSYASHNWRWISTGLTFLTFKKWITYGITEVAVLSILLYIINIRNFGQTLFSKRLIIIVSSEYKYQTRMGVAMMVALFSNRTYFVDMICNNKMFAN